MSLQKLCLHIIAKNFDSYFSVYWSTSDVNLKRKFEFLQRKYAYEIVDKLFKEFRIRKKHADFVFNKYLTTLDSKWFGNCSWRKIVAKMAEIGPEVKKIYFSDSKIRPWQKVFCYLPNLEVMHHNYYCVDEVLSSIAKYCPEIREIKLTSRSPGYIDKDGSKRIKWKYFSKITDAGLKSLCKTKNGITSCSKLKSIVTNAFMEVPEEDVEYLLKNLPSLEIFICNYLPEALHALNQKELSTFEKVAPYKLVWLNLNNASEHPDYEDLIKVSFSLCPNLKHLIFPVMKPQQLNLTSELSNLETVSIDNFYEHDFLDVNDFLKLKGNGLKSLKLHKCTVSLTTLAKACPSLKQLILSAVDVKCDENCDLPNKHFDPITLEISEFGFEGENLRSACFILSSSPMLETITFRGYNFSTSSVIKTAILNCCEKGTLKKIDLRHCRVKKQFLLDILNSCHSLSILMLDDDWVFIGEIRECAKRLINNPKIRPLEYDMYDDPLDCNYDFGIIENPFDS